MESVSDAPLTKLLLKIASSLEHEQVVTIRSVRIALWDRLVHQQRELQLIRQCYCDIECGIFVSPHGVMQPIQDELGARRTNSSTHHARPLREMVGERLKNIKRSIVIHRIVSRGAKVNSRIG
jgi:hypothetical protein